MTYYHVCKRWDGHDLESLYRQHRDDAYAIYADRWPDAGELAQYHIMVVHCYDNIDDAIAHKDAFGGDVLAIDADVLDRIGITHYIDTLEFAHPVVSDYIPAEAITRIK
jgi:hypothetical protein